MTNPIFKTFYNHRVFLIYQPDAYRNYLLGMVDQTSWPETEKFSLTLGLMAWGTILVYRARMVPFDFNRRLKALVDANGAFFNQNPTVPLSRNLYRQELAMQLGIEAITREPDVKERIEETPILAQYIYDTLYLPSFYHERGRYDVTADGKPKRFTATRIDLRDHLWYRAQGDPTKLPPADFVSSEVIDYLFEVLKRYIALLGNPRNIRDATSKYASELPSDDRRLWLALADAIDPQQLLTFDIKRERATSAASM